MQEDTFVGHQSPGIASTLLMTERSNIWQRTQEATGFTGCGFRPKNFCISSCSTCRMLAGTGCDILDCSHRVPYLGRWLQFSCCWRRKGVQNQAD